MTDIQVGDTVKVNRFGDNFDGVTGVAIEPNYLDSDSMFKIRAGDGTGDHGDRANGHWWVETQHLTKVPSLLQKGDKVTFSTYEGEYEIVHVEGTEAWVKVGSDRFIATTDLLHLVPEKPNELEVGVTYSPAWNPQAQFAVKDIWKTPNGDRHAVGFYSYDLDDRSDNRWFIDSYPVEIKGDWTVVEG